MHSCLVTNEMLGEEHGIGVGLPTVRYLNSIEYQESQAIVPKYAAGLWPSHQRSVCYLEMNYGSA